MIYVRMSDDLLVKFRRAGVAFRTIRRSTDRPNLAIRVTKSGGVTEINSLLQEFFRKDVSNESSRIIIYTFSISLIDRIMGLSQFSNQMTTYSSANTDFSNQESNPNGLGACGQSPSTICW